MKHLHFIMILAVLLIGCGPKELNREEALTLIKKERGYPRVVDFDVFTADPAHAKRLLVKGLETEGMVTIQKTQKMIDIGKPLIKFTAKAGPYLLRGSETDVMKDIQKVRIADEDITEVTSITDNRNNTIVVEYTTLYKNLTPFAVLLSKNGGKPKSHTVTFSLSDNGWMIEKWKK